MPPLVYEAYLRLVGNQWFDGRGHFFAAAAAAEAMRRILVDVARRKATVRHGGNRRRVWLADRCEEAVKTIDQNQGANAAFDWLFLAMAHHRLGKADKTKEYLDKAADWIDAAMVSSPLPPRVDFSGIAAESNPGRLSRPIFGTVATNRESPAFQLCYLFKDEMEFSRSSSPAQKRLARESAFKTGGQRPGSDSAGSDFNGPSLFSAQSTSVADASGSPRLSVPG